jgi:arylsulfatase
MIKELETDSTPARPEILYPPAGAPNVVVVMLDDVGFGAASTFGGPVPTPALDRVAAGGVSYIQYRPSLLEGKTHFTLYRDHVRQPEMAAVNVKNTSFDLHAKLQIPEGAVDGVVICQGGNMAGWSLYVKDGRPVYFYNLYGRELTSVAGAEPLPSGDVELGVRFEYDGGGLGKGGLVHLTVNGAEVAGGRLERTVPFLFSMSGETLDVGVDTGAPVGPYPPRFPFTGTIDRIEIELHPRLDERRQRELLDGQIRGALASQ